MPVTQLVCGAITVGDLAGAAAFYRDALGLEVGPEHALADPAWGRVLGLAEGTAARAVDIAVGRQMLELIAFDPPGRPYPAERASNDPWFQHFALVCGDIAAVWRRLEAASPGLVTGGEPVLLPPNTGRVTAFKFRDPEGHPLELIAFPPGVGDPVWQATGTAGIRGFDHTAITVADLDRSIAFYTGLLGFRIAGRSLNVGPEQDRLDGLAGCEVDVVALAPAAVATPHVELLHYRLPAGRTAMTIFAVNDVASVRQIHKVDGLPALLRRLEAAGAAFVSPGAVPLQSGGTAAAVRDPDGHILVLMERVKSG